MIDVWEMFAFFYAAMKANEGLIAEFALSMLSGGLKLRPACVLGTEDFLTLLKIKPLQYPI